MLSGFKAYRMAKEFYQACKQAKVPLFLRDQLSRASSSVVLNLAEGAGKRTFQDQRHYYSIAFGSLREARAILEMENINDPSLERLADELSAILYTLSRRKDPARPKTETAPETEN